MQTLGIQAEQADLLGRSPLRVIHLHVDSFNPNQVNYSSTSFREIAEQYLWLSLRLVALSSVFDQFTVSQV